MLMPAALPSLSHALQFGQQSLRDLDQGPSRQRWQRRQSLAQSPAASSGGMTRERRKGYSRLSRAVTLPLLPIGTAREEKPEVARPGQRDPRGEEAGMEELRRRVALHGPPRFECPEDFTAISFAPGPPFSPEMLQDPTKQLLLIRAPANFSPEW
ncbi:hypothetical protein JRQ81_011914 [Phrynocephalus forsythii]|uniref:Uncharacterized protein n=1 Tax=Phrynocephalus forsythii TaxID=171643 RepID=A0A9Q1AR02_9SAUR|nr:hypothetical protein JRQ81_011914 [Phrynocephalus forsythii]